MVFSELWDDLFGIFFKIVEVFDLVLDFVYSTLNDNIVRFLGDNFLVDLITWITSTFGVGELTIVDMIIGYSLPLVLLVAIVKFFGDLFQN